MMLRIISFICLIGASQCLRYCQPGDTCWPSQDDIEELKSLLSPPTLKPECFGPFLSADEPGNPVENPWYPDAGSPITPYALGNLRNKVKDNPAYFIVVPRQQSDVIAAVRFATSHNLGISVFGTGHEFNDRNSGLEANSLLIRTTCLNDAELVLDEENKFGHPDGYARLGAGMTWGTSKFGAVGVHERAKDVGRVVVSGHAGNVGVVGWSLGGGHGQLVGVHGLGVDQVLEIEMVIADGSVVVANNNGTLVTSEGGQTEWTPDNDLFWAVRGGGAGPWGVVTDLTVKLHKPRNECTTDCYTQTTAIYGSTWDEDDGEMAEEVTQAYLTWVGSIASKYWSSYASYFPGENGDYYISIEAFYVGKESEADEEDYNSFLTNVVDTRSDKIVYFHSDKFDTFFDKLVAQVPESVNAIYNVEMMPSVLLNETATIDPSLTKDLVDMWIPRCYRNGLLKSCVYGYLFMHTLTGDEDDNDLDSAAVSPTFRRAKMHLLPTYYINLLHEMSYLERSTFAHEVVAPTLYKHSEHSYYSESEYSLNDDDSWKERFWGMDIYERLLRIKKTWDPELVFSCRHCVGDGEVPAPVSSNTLPSWRFQAWLASKWEAS